MCENVQGQKITFTFKMVNPAPPPGVGAKTRRFIVCLDLVAVFRFDVKPGATKTLKVLITAGVATFRLHPKAWCKSFLLPEQVGDAEALFTTVGNEIGDILTLRGEHEGIRGEIKASEMDLIHAVEQQDEGAFNSALDTITDLENQDTEKLNKIESHDTAIGTAYGFPAEVTSMVVELNLTAFNIKLNEVPAGRKITPGVKMCVNGDDDDLDGVVDQFEAPVPGEKDLLPYLFLFAKPVPSEFDSGLVSTPLLLIKETDAIKTWKKSDKSESFALPQSFSESFKRGRVFMEAIKATGGPPEAPTPEVDFVIGQLGSCNDRFRIRAAEIKFRIRNDDDTEFVDLDTSTPRGLYFGRWFNGYKTVDTAPGIAVLDDFISHDPDRYLVRLIDRTRAKEKKVTVKLETRRKISGGSLLDINPLVDLELTATSEGVFDSKDLMLMGDRVDDSFVNAATGGVKNNLKGDLTFLGRSGFLNNLLTGKDNGQVVVQIKVDNKDCEFVAPICDTAASSDPKKSMHPLKVKVHMIVITVSGKAVVDPSIPADDEIGLLERYAQACMQFDTVKTDVIAEPAGVDLSDGLDLRESFAKITAEERALIRGARKATGDVDGDGNPVPQDHIDIIYINRFSEGGKNSKVAGESFPAKELPTDDKDLRNSVVVARFVLEDGNLIDIRDHVEARDKRKSYTVVPHECGHILLDSGSDAPNFGVFKANLMNEANVNPHQVLLGQRLDVPPVVAPPSFRVGMRTDTGLPK